MPELPEVETVKRLLEKKITGHTITKLEILTAKSFIGDPCGVIGQKITHFTRLGKQLSIHLSNHQILLVHLKMTGQLIYLPAVSKEGIGKGLYMGHPTKDMFTTKFPSKSTRLIFTFSNHSTLYFNDQRKFGWVKVLSRDELVESQSKVGIDILDPRYTLQYFTAQLKTTSRPIKVVLLDQNKFAGLGNIYANDALFIAKIDPRHPAKSIPAPRIRILHRATIDLINESINHGGSTAKDNLYLHPDGTIGSHQYHFRVYQRQKEPCPICGQPILRLNLGGRGTFYCSHCQK